MKRTVLWIAMAAVVVGGGSWSVAEPGAPAGLDGRQAAAPAAPGGPAAGTVVRATVAAPSLQGNLLGDPAQVPVAVYLPPGYDASGSRRYPAVYLLHGFLGNADTFARFMRVPDAMNARIAAGTPEMIVVMPSGRNGLFGSFYANSPATGNWEDFVVRDLVGWVDREYRTLASAESRGVAGHSMGGYGALMLGMKHPDVFGALYALSPCCVALESDIGADNQAWHKALQLRSRGELSGKPQSLDEFYITAFVALAAALSPDPAQAPFYAALPFRVEDERLVPADEAYTRWRTNMPLYAVERYRANLERLRGIYLDYGEHEEFPHIRSASRALSEALAARGIPHTFEVYPDGDHMNKIPERIRTRVISFFAETLKR